MSNAIIGNAIALAALLSGASEDVMLWIMFGCAMLGFIITSSVTKPKRPLKSQPKTTIKQKLDLANRFRTYKKLFSTKDICLSFNYIYAQGMCYIFTFGGLPYVITFLTDFQNASIASSSNSASVTSSSTENEIGILIAGNFLLYGVVSAICGVAFGKIYDKFGWKPIVILNTIVLFVNFALLLLVNWFAQLNWMMYVNAILFAITDNACNCVLNMTLARDYPKFPEIFAIYRFVFCLGVVSYAVLSLFIPFYFMFIPVGVCQVLGHALFHYRSVCMRKNQHN